QLLSRARRPPRPSLFPYTTLFRSIVTAKKLFNVREGWTAAEDTLPRRFLSEGLPAGADTTAVLPAERLREMIAAYYAARGWEAEDRKSTRLNSSHSQISYAVFCLK